MVTIIYIYIYIYVCVCVCVFVCKIQNINSVIQITQAIKVKSMCNISVVSV
jgi:hypothetical protein